MRVLNKLGKPALFFGFILFFLNWKLDVAAAEGSVVFGSGSYTWYTEETCPIGVYIESATPIAAYEICLEYDPGMLEYLDGAAEVIDNKIYLRGDGTERRYRNMLHFKPLTEGASSIQVVSAQAVTTEDISGGNASQNIDMTLLSTAPVTIRQFVSNEIVSIQTSPEALQNFRADVKEYSLTVEAETENLEVEYTLLDENAPVSLSDTKLATGENVITLSVQGTEGNNVYTFTVYRKELESTVPIATEPSESAEPEPAEAQEASPADTEAITAASENNVPDNSSNEHTPAFGGMDLSLIIASAFCIVLLLLYCAIKIKKVLANREKDGGEEGEAWQDETLRIINFEKTVIDIAHVTMRFRMAQDEISSLKEYFINVLKRKNKYRMLTALDDISFEVKQGDVVGIIGTNGSGKSTLLKIISGALTPTSGSVTVDKSKIQILTLGTGFDMELTGRENVYLNGAIIGYSKAYIDEKYDDIVAFAELNGFMEEKMKNFSTGMVTRLGFAIATMQDTPEILILDEVLSVGDMFFKQKSEKRIKEMIHSGATVLMVSHGVETILKNCNKVIWIEKGIMKMAGEPKEVCTAYKNYVQ